MLTKELDFERISRQAREFREQEEQRIANEKEEEARRILAKKTAERERIAQSYDESLEIEEEPRQERQQQQRNDRDDNGDSTSETPPPSTLEEGSTRSRLSSASPGAVKRLAGWLAKREKNATARRLLEEEFNDRLAERRYKHPEEAVMDSEAAVKAALEDEDNDKGGASGHFRNITRIADRVRFAESRLQKSSSGAGRVLRDDGYGESKEVDRETPFSPFDNSREGLPPFFPTKDDETAEESKPSIALTIQHATLRFPKEEARKDLNDEFKKAEAETEAKTPVPEYTKEQEASSDGTTSGYSEMEDAEDEVANESKTGDIETKNLSREETKEKKAFCDGNTSGDDEVTNDGKGAQNDLFHSSEHPASVDAVKTARTEEKPRVECLPMAEPQNDSNLTTVSGQPRKEKTRPAVHQYGVEVDPRTQAMVAEDDFMSTGNNRDNDPNAPSRPGIRDLTQDRNKKELVHESSFPSVRKSIGRINGSSGNRSDEDDDMGPEIVYKEATFEIPVELVEDGLKLSPNTADLTMVTTIPPSHLGGKVSGRLEGKSSFGDKANTAHGSASLQYRSSRHTRLALGMIRGCEPHHPLITMGGQLFRHGSCIGVTFFHNAKFLHQMMLEHSLWSLSFRHCFRDSKWRLSSELSRKQDLSLSIANGNKLSGMIGWNLLKPRHFHARIDARPRITEYRRAHLYCQWKASSGPGVWNFGISLVQCLHSRAATLGLGWRLFSTRGLEWVVSWSRGNGTIRIPILLSKGLAARATIGHSLYCSIVSYLVQDYIAEAWGWIGNGDDEDGDNDASHDAALAIRAQNLTKSKRDAAMQIELMARQARRKTRDEKERDGLIIKEATYRIENGEEWDVTIPLQFWVSRSALTLSASPKSELLGFYDVAASLKNARASSAETGLDSPTTRPSRSRLFPSWSDIWCDLLDRTPKDSKKATECPSPKLTVRYEFKGQSHETTVKDREELRLPHT